jgi:hypothetical protein
MVAELDPLHREKQTMVTLIGVGIRLLCTHGFYKIPQISMPDRAGIPIVLNVRAVLVIAALICLCVSSNVGPQFLPLPPATIQLAQDVHSEEPGHAWHTPQAGARCFRVPMMAQSKKRADKEPSQSHQFIVLPSDRFSLPRHTRFSVAIGYSGRFLTSVTMAPAAGRAPPSLV